MQARARALAAALSLVLLVEAAAAPALADYGPTIVGGTSSNSERKVSSAPDGTLYATFTEPVGNTTGIAVKRSTDGGTTWQFLPRLGTAEAFRSCIAVDQSGALHIAWTEFVGPDRQVFYARWAGGPNWTAQQRMSDTPGYSGFPSLAVDAHDQVHLVWYGFDGTTYQVYYRYMDSQGWHATVQATHGVQDANNPTMVVTENATAHVAFFTYVRGDVDVWYLQGGPRGWSAPQRVNPAGVPSTDPSIAFVNGTPAIAYASGANSTLEVRYVERDAASNWSNNLPVSELGEGGNHPSLVTDGQGNVAVLYENASGHIRIRARVHGQWGAATTLATSGDARWVSAAFVPWGSGPAGGNVTALWTEGAGGNFTVAFGKAAPFPPIAPGCLCGPNPWEGWAIPLLFVLVAGATVAAMAIASARTRGGGRG